MKIAVFASGNGSNFQRLVDFKQGGQGLYEIALLICDRPNAHVIKRAVEARIPYFATNPKAYPDKSSYEQDILNKLQAHGVDWIVLAGYLRLVGSTLLGAYPNKIINLHPSLLPSFPGLYGIRDAFQYGVKVTGVTVHFVDEGLDTGPIIAQEPVQIEGEDTIESLSEKIHQVEHRLLPNVVNLLVQNKIKLQDGKVRIEGQAEGNFK